MKLVSWNVNGIRACYSKGLLDFLHKNRPDILCLQETKASRKQLPIDMQTLGYPFVEWAEAERKGYSGVATFCAYPAKFKIGLNHVSYDREGRVIVAEFAKCLVYNIYFPNGGSGPERHHFKQGFLAYLLKHLRDVKNRHPEKVLIVVGDYNVAPYPIDVYDPQGLADASGFLPEERAWFQEFFALGFVDLFRQFHPNEAHRYSWWSYKEYARIGNKGWRIDFICVSENGLESCKDANLLEDVMGSDHCPVVAEFDETLFVK